MTTLALPYSSFSHLDIEPEHFIAETLSLGGFTSEITYADAMWAGTMSTIPLTERELRRWEAFIAKATERKLPFDFVHPTKRTPISYTMTSLPFSGDATIQNMDDLRSPVMAGLPIGLILKEGDRFSMTEDDYVSSRLVAEDLVVSSATAQAVPCTPRLPLGRFTTAATVEFKEPTMRLRVVKNTWSAPLNASEQPVGSFRVVEAPR